MPGPRPTNAANPASVAPSIRRDRASPPTSRTMQGPATRTTSGSGPKAGVAIPRGLARRPKCPLDRETPAAEDVRRNQVQVVAGRGHPDFGE